MGRRLKFGLLAVLGLISIAIASSVAGSRSWVDPASTSKSATSRHATSAPAPTPAPQGDPPEQNTGPAAVRGEANLAGPPLRTAGRFVATWLNRSRNAAAVRAERPALVGLSTGNFAQLMQVTIADTLATGKFGPSNEGTVEFSKLEDADPGQASVLVICRERPQGPEDFTYTIYLAKLVAVAPGRFAMNDLVPQ